MSFNHSGSGLIKLLIITALIIVTGICSGQSDSIKSVPGSNSEIKVSYNSTLIYPGASLGAAFLIKERYASGQNEKRRLNYTGTKQLLTINLSWYHHPEFHDNLYMTSEWLIRRIRKRGYYSEFSAGPGFSRTFLGGTTYKVGDDGKVSKVMNAGYSYAMVSVGGGMGYNLHLIKEVPLSVFTRMNLIFMFPYNSTVYFRPVLELGVRLNSSIFSLLKKE